MTDVARNPRHSGRKSRTVHSSAPNAKPLMAEGDVSRGVKPATIQKEMTKRGVITGQSGFSCSPPG
jgi:hypothetical protein